MLLPLLLLQLAESTPTPRPTRPPPMLGRTAPATPIARALGDVGKEKAAADAEYKRLVADADAAVAKQQEALAVGIRALNEDFRQGRIDGWTFDAKKKELLDQERDVYERGESAKRRALNDMRKGPFAVSSPGGSYARYAKTTPEKDEKGAPIADKPQPRVRVTSTTYTVADSIGNVWISGMVYNAGPGDACFVKIGVRLVTKDAATLGTNSTHADSSKIPKGESSSFKTYVTVPAGTRIEVRGGCSGTPYASLGEDACITKQNQASRGPEIDHAEGFIEDADACR